MEKFFKIKERGSTLKTEIFAGITTFFAMAYIIFVNPNQVAAEGANGWLVGLGADPGTMGQIWNSVYIASIIVAIIGTLLMAFVADMPFAQACGMGLNSFFFLHSYINGATNRSRLCPNNFRRLVSRIFSFVTSSHFASVSI